MNLKVLTVKHITPKRIYMQSEAFWKDKHNATMFELSEKLIKHRDKIAQNVALNNSQQNVQVQVQGINGFARIKKFLDTNKNLHFWNEPSICDRANYDYSIIKTRIYNLAREFKSKIGR